MSDLRLAILVVAVVAFQVWAWNAYPALHDTLEKERERVRQLRARADAEGRRSRKPLRPS